ncbi:DUF4185 domain-containing protein [Mycolicibacterium smegmatis]|uniref:DUF4185 domain-containing protein n=1 Tax=Mycolicibacterium smegmatis TaxID=1772 RepID=UPI001EFB6158|nr:DUF4185 domain-containing protein [Mycolicibacterium smegmatis]ULN33127.1 DUF4185 domain-containing protein [Mycolicibacterium smegmatis]
MGSTTGGAAHVGRIGALAVALGIGAALTTGTGVAWADDSGASGGSTSSSSSASDSSSSSAGGSSGSASGGADAAKPRKPGVTKPRIQPTGKIAESLKKTAKAVEGAVADAHKRAQQSAAQQAEKRAERRAKLRAQIRPGKDTDKQAPEKQAGNEAKNAAQPATKTQRQLPAAPAVKVPDVITSVRARSDEVAREITTGVTGIRTAIENAAPRIALPDLRPTTNLARPVTPVALKAAQPVQVSPPRPTITGLVRGLLTAAAGFSPRAATAPVAPAPSPAAWALLAFARREFERAFTPGAATALAAPAITTSAVTSAAVVNPLPGRLDSVPVGWVTGVSNPSGNWPQTNNTAGFDIWGTDLGIMWDGGEWNGQRFVHTAFGDTFSGPNMSGWWRSNVLLISTDNVLSDGLGLVQTGTAYQFIPASGRNLFGLFGGSEVTVIPTAGVQIDGTQYVNYMSVRSWDTPGRWTTNFSAISVYDPSTDTWVLAPSTIRSAGWFRSSTLYVPGSQNFQQAAYVLQPEDQVGEDGIRYLYAFGTPSGRAGSAYLSRVPEDAVTDLSKYEYWDGNRWVTGNAAVAAPVIGDSTRSTGLFGFIVDWANDPNVLGGYLGGLVGAKTGGNVSELSVQYNEYLGKYVVLYGDGNNNIQMRIADRPEGPWSDPIELASSADYPGLYAPMIHPWSGTGMLEDDNGDPDVTNLYWNMSLWGDYNVVLMQTDLSGLKTVAV